MSWWPDLWTGMSWLFWPRLRLCIDSNWDDRSYLPGGLWPKRMTWKQWQTSKRNRGWFSNNSGCSFVFICFYILQGCLVDCQGHFDRDGETNKEGAEPDRHLRDDRAKNMLSGVFLARPATGYVAKCASHRSMGSICSSKLMVDLQITPAWGYQTQKSESQITPQTRKLQLYKINMAVM